MSFCSVQVFLGQKEREEQKCRNMHYKEPNLRIYITITLCSDTVTGPNARAKP